MMGDTCDVIVVGAGPVGATAALLLADYGLKCAVVEARREPQSHPAAHVLSTRSMEIWREIGLERDIRRLSAPMHELRSVLYCTTLVGPELGRVPLGGCESCCRISQPDPQCACRSAFEPLLWQTCATMRASAYALGGGTALTPTAQTASRMHHRRHYWGVPKTGRPLCHCRGWLGQHRSASITGNDGRPGPPAHDQRAFFRGS